MDTTATTSGLPPDVEADAQAVIDSLTSGKPLDPGVARRVHERAQGIREEIYQQHGLLDLGVPLIRELRGDLPNP
jgi:hypothetical protein